MASKNDYDFTFSPEDEIYFAEDADQEDEQEIARTDCMLAIAKVLVEIRDELRRMNNGNT